MTMELPEMMLVDKPSGITSFDIIRILQKKLKGTHGKVKMGHAGTLDPMASGLMIIGVEKGTKALEGFLKLPKSYIAEIVLGVATDTGDTEGVVVAEKNVMSIDPHDIERTVQSMLGTHAFQVPIFSAIKVEGKPLYWYAHRGIEPPRIPTKTMTINRAEILDHYTSREGRYIVRVRFDVESGTYIRTLAGEFGRLLGYPAMLRYLRRVSIGDFSVEDAEKL